jgi:short-subunit dehydrogenase
MGTKGWIAVTGASSGIGLQTAKQLMMLGYGVVATAKNGEKLNNAFKDVDGAVIRIPWDLSEIQSIKDYSKTVNSQVGPISGLVHCAGIQKTMPMHMTSEKNILEVFKINTFAAMMLVSALSKKGMYIENLASFILISSISAQEGALGQTIYGASKGALDGFIKPAAAELTGKGIRMCM